MTHEIGHTTQDTRHKKMRPASCVFVSLCLVSLICSISFAEDSLDESDWESKARQAHKVAASDMMYQNEEWKALYYQNQQIIQLLKQVRDSLEVIKLHGNKENSEEKSG